MTIKLYNTAGRRKEEFHPLHHGKVGIYVCGVTVYDLCHIGHARSAIVFDVLVRYLRARGFDVTYVRNFTDVDDKIIERARQAGKETGILAQEYIDAFSEDMERIGVLKADVEPRATEHINGMIDMISTLISKEFAYVEDGDVFYSVEKFEEYGRLSGRRLEDMKAGSRIAVDKRKRHPMDFVLWKGAKPGEPQWPSPWGPGRPGWHMECSVMSNHYLGATFDIHGGGQDLLFPHHENERAQSIAANNGKFARYWVHNGFVTVESEKMSKSLGNFLTIRDALKSYHPEVLRLFLLSKHYRSPLDFSKDAVSDLQSGLVRIYRTLQRLESLIGEYEEKRDIPASASLAGGQKDQFLEMFIHIMDDDLNTAGAMGLIFEKVKEMNRLMDLHDSGLDERSVGLLKNDRHHLFMAARVLGFLAEHPEDFFRKLSHYAESVDVAEIERMIEERTRARAEKDWAMADVIRDHLQGIGVVLEDGPQGTRWRFDV
ncbi:MAG: cysteine--tRNA ligase [Deltaproteobacteria bacterium]|nr:cysteine--tRNA ligase [Deltaproteobacteria bacterium]